jgi:site-specific DNA-methyltransferase (adenine-specific)
MKDGSFDYANKDRMIGTVIDITTGARGSIKHPTVKPVPLFEHLIKTYTNEGELVLDNTAGSGTTAIACLNTNRQFIVMEKEQKYYDMILKRVGDFNKNFEPKTLFGNEM